MGFFHVNRFAPKAQTYQQKPLNVVNFNYTSTSPPMGVCARPTNSRQPIRLVAGSHIEGGKLADPTDFIFSDRSL